MSLDPTPDPYAILICESCAARTNTINNSRNPSWRADMPRAFKFDLACPFSTLSCGIKDEDVGTDGDIGFVVVELNSLR